MATEVIDARRQPFQMREEDMKKADLCSLGMLFYCLVNPNCCVPYLLEARGSGLKMDQWQHFLTRKTGVGAIPSQDPDYDHTRLTYFSGRGIQEVHKGKATTANLFEGSV